MTEEQASRAALQALIQLHLVRLWVNIEVDKVQQDEVWNQEHPEELAGFGGSADAMLALRTGKPEEGLRFLSQGAGRATGESRDGSGV